MSINPSVSKSEVEGGWKFVYFKGMSHRILDTSSLLLDPEINALFQSSPTALHTKILLVGQRRGPSFPYPLAPFTSHITWASRWGGHGRVKGNVLLATQQIFTVNNGAWFRYNNYQWPFQTVFKRETWPKYERLRVTQHWKFTAMRRKRASKYLFLNKLFWNSIVRQTNLRYMNFCRMIQNRKLNSRSRRRERATDRQRKDKTRNDAAQGKIKN